MDDRQINDYEQHEEMHTVIYNAAGEEIDRKEGRVTVRPKDYTDQLPITCKQVKVTTECSTSTASRNKTNHHE